MELQRSCTGKRGNKARFGESADAWSVRTKWQGSSLCLRNEMSVTIFYQDKTVFLNDTPYPFIQHLKVKGEIWHFVTPLTHYFKSPQKVFVTGSLSEVSVLSGKRRWGPKMIRREESIFNDLQPDSVYLAFYLCNQPQGKSSSKNHEYKHEGKGPRSIYELNGEDEKYLLPHPRSWKSVFGLFCIFCFILGVTKLVMLCLEQKELISGWHLCSANIFYLGFHCTNLIVGRQCWKNITKRTKW